MLRKLVATSVVILSLSSGDLAAQSVDLRGLTGTWTDGSGRTVEIEQTGSQLFVRLHDGRIFEGERQQSALTLEAPYKSLDTTPANLPLEVRQKLLDDPIRLQGTVSQQDELIEAELIIPRYNLTTFIRQEPQRAAVRLIKRLGARICPAVIRNVVLDDLNRGISCPAGVTLAQSFKADGAATTAQLLEKYFQAHPDLLVERPPQYSVAACEDVASLSDSQNARMREVVVAEYYWSRKRLAEGVLAALESIAALERLEDMSCAIQTPGASNSVSLLRTISCADVRSVPEAERACQFLKQQCPGRTNLTSVLEQTELGHRKLDILDAARSALNNEMERLVTPGGLYDVAEVRRLGAERDRLDAERRVVEGAVPWLTGDAYKGGYAEALAACRAQPSAGEGFCDGQRARSTCLGLRREATRQREATERRLKRYLQAFGCVDSRDASCALSAEAFRQTVGAAPLFSSVRALAPYASEDRRRASYASSAFTLAQCRSGVREAQDEADAAVREFITSSALTVATAGIGSVAAGVRAASLAAKTADAAAKGVRTARALELTGLVLNAADLGRGVATAIAQCNATYELGDHMANERGATPVCPAGDRALGAGLTQSYTECILSGVGTQVALAGLPLLPAGVSALVDRSTLRAAAEALGADLKVLTAQQRAAVLDVFRSRLAGLSGEELAPSIQKLKAANFSDDGINRLLARFAPDLQFIGGSVVRAGTGRLLQATDLPIGNAVHKLAVKEIGGVKQVWLCSVCGPVLARLDDLVSAPGLAPEVRARLNAFRIQIEELQDSLRHLSAKDLEAELGKLAASLRGQTDEASRLALSTLVRAGGELGEVTSQRQLRGIFDGIGFTDAALPGPLSEPVFKNGQLIGYVRRDASLIELADDLGIDRTGYYSREWRALPSDQRTARAAQVQQRVDAEVKSALKDSTRPDFFGTEIRNGRMVEVAYELKTPRQGDERVFQFFRNELQRPPRKVGGRFDEPHWILDQAGGRVQNLPPGLENNLIIDLRNVNQTVEQAMEDLAAIAKLSEYRGLGQFYKNVRFIVGGTTDPVMTALREFPR